MWSFVLYRTRDFSSSFHLYYITQKGKFSAMLFDFIICIYVQFSVQIRKKITSYVSIHLRNSDIFTAFITYDNMGEHI